jgi:acyl-coenzyme A thioesterase PaaI-like protein
MDLLLKNAFVAKTLLNLWPPFWGAGIKIENLSREFTVCRVRLAFRWWNKNANRSQFGGAIFSMTDPIYPLMLMAILGNRYHVWDSEASIKFVTPGRSRVYAEFQLDHDFIQQIIAQAANGEKHTPTVTTKVVDEQGTLIAVVTRRLYIRLKREYRPAVQQLA